MLRGFVICPDQELRERIESVLTELGQVAILRVMDRYVSDQELSRYIRAYAPEVIFLSIESMSRAFEMVQTIERDTPGVQVVALHRSCDPQTLLEVMRAGIREFLAPPFQHQVIYEALGRLQEIIEKNPPEIETADNIFAFLPSKAGVGTTTTAVNTAFALASKLNLKGLMMDMDLGNGIVRFMLKLSNLHSIVDAVEHVLDMDINLWPQLVTNLGTLDILHAGHIESKLRKCAT
jgi:Flp pilus assembly CpaE family ATPase